MNIHPNWNSEMRSFFNSSDSTIGRTSNVKYTRIEDVDLPPARRKLLPKLQFSALRGTASDEKKPQSLDYSVCYNTPYRDYLKRNASLSYLGVSRRIWISMWSWIMVGIIGILTGMVAFLINFIIKYLNQLRYGTMLSVFYKYFDTGYMILAFLTLLAFNMLFVLIAALLTGFEPLAAGSGIPEIKCYLNGIKVPHVVRLRTLVIKATGVLFSVAGGLLVGKEGPMIHSGAIIGAGVPQFRTFAVPKSVRNWRIFNFPLTMFRNDKDKRDFVSAGAAAGVAAAFGAPIGGVLFALEEGCSFWNQSLTWKALFCSMCAFFGLNMLSGLTMSKQQQDYLKNHHVITLIGEGLISFGTFPQEKILWTAKDLLIFILMGFGGGILGATFNAINRKLTIYRFKFMHKRKGFLGLCWPRVAEAVLVAIITTMVTFLPSMILGTCAPITEELSKLSNATLDTLDLNITTIPCPENGAYFNDLGILLNNPLEKTIYQLFHNTNFISFQSLTIAFVFTFFTACWTYGTGVPSGLFVPCLMIGAIYGRLVGNVVQIIYNRMFNLSRYATPFGFYIGTYALVGAASFLGGVVRMTISLAVIILESTNEILFGLPVVLALMVAKWTGDYFNEGLYDIHIHLKRMPLLEWDPPEEADLLTAKDVMSRNLIVLREQESVEFVVKVLMEKSHSGFVIVKNQLYQNFTGLSPVELNINDLTFSPEASDKSNSITVAMERSFAEKYEPASFQGMVLRSQLLALLHYKAYDDQEYVIPHQDMIRFYPKGLNTTKLFVSEEDRRKLINLRPYMNPSPYTVLKDTCLTQVFEVFRTMGLRHLVVLDDQGRALGLITRKDLTEENLKRVLRRIINEENNAN